MAVQENTWNVANRMHSSKDSDNPALNHIITGADEIYDDDKGKKQSVINAETAATLANHTTAINAIDSQNYADYTASAGQTLNQILPAVGSADTIYRVGKWDGSQYDTTSYAEYVWSGTAYTLMDVKAYGIDEVPTANSENLVKSSGIYEECVEAGQVVGDPAGDWIESDAQTYVDNRIAEIRGGVSPGFNTLKKLQDVYTSLTAEKFATVPTYASLPVSGSTDTLYRVSSYDGTQVDATKYAEYAWNGSAYVLLAVRSQIDQVFDISEYNNATYNDLADALSGTNVPDGVKHGGMSVKFIQNVPNGDNKYVQYRLTANKFTTNILYWKECNVVSTDNQNFSDLDISDEQGNVLIRASEGHIKTKNFDSSKDASELERGLMSANDKTKLNTIEQGAEINDVETENVTGSEDLDVSDENGNVLLILKNGNIKTKNFDSTEVKVKIQEDNTIKSIDGENPISVVKETPGLSAIIQDWGFIGDSLMSGTPNSNVVEVEDLIPMPDGRNFYKYSWGQMMCRLTGAFGTNYSNGGQTTKGWLNDYPGHTLNRYNSDGTWEVSFSATHKIAYAISLGANDKRNFATRYPNGVGDLQNVHVSSADYTENDLNTYAGCFGKIISLCKEVSPSSRVFVITTPNIESNILSDILTIQRAIANSNIFSHVYLVDLNAYMEDTQIRNIYGDGHLYCQGYMYYAYCVMTYIDYIIRQNPSDFANIQFIEYLKTDTGQI